jgi:hypothetical protein
LSSVSDKPVVVKFDGGLLQGNRVKEVRDKGLKC